MKKKFSVEHAEDGGRQRRRLAAADRDEQHREQVDDAEPGRRRDRVERGDRPGRERDCDDRIGDRTAAPLAEPGPEAPHNTIKSRTGAVGREKRSSLRPYRVWSWPHRGEVSWRVSSRLTDRPLHEGET